MMKLIASLLCVLMLGAMASAQFFVQSMTDNEIVEVIEQVKRIPASRLDPALPRVSFIKWLQTQAGPGGRVVQGGVHYVDAGFGSAEEDHPTGIEFNAFTADGYWINILIGIGSQGKVGDCKPFVLGAYLEKHGESTSFDRLSDLSAALRLTPVQKVLSRPRHEE